MTEPVRPLKPQRRDPARLAAAQAGARAGAPSALGSGADPAVERALQLKAFERSFDVDDLISALSDRQIAASKASTGAFDAKPFIATFSPALDRLLALRTQVADKTGVLEGEVRVAEREYAGRLRELDGGFENIGSSFAALETKITGVGRTAIRIGEQLEALHVSRSLAQSTSILLSYYLSLASPVSATPSKSAGSAPGTEPEVPQTPLETLFATRTTREGRAHLAVILRRLAALARDIRDLAHTALQSHKEQSTAAAEQGGKGAGGEAARLQTDLERAERILDEVDKYGERFEKECLRLFDRSYRKGDVRMMAHCAKILLDFNGGHSCVQMYVNQHDFFISKERVLEEAAKIDTERNKRDRENQRMVVWEELSDPDRLAPTHEPGLVALFQEIRVTVEQEAQIIQAVFPMKEEVMRVFLQRVFAQVIQQQLEQLFSRAATMSSLALLRMLRLTHAMCSALVEDLKTYDFSAFGGPDSADAANSQVGTTVALATLLDNAMDEIFSPFLEGQRYVELEIKHLSGEYSAMLAKFTRYHEGVIKAKANNSLLDRVVNQLSTSTTAKEASSAATSTAASAASAAAAWFNKYSGSKDAVRTAPGSGSATPTRLPVGNAEDDKAWEVDGFLKLPTAEQILRWHAEAVGRVVELSQPGQVPANALTLSKLLADFIGRAYLELYLDSAIAKVDVTDSKSAPELGPLTALKQVDLALQLWQKYLGAALLPLSSANVTSRREMAATNAAIVTRLEQKVNTVLQRTIEASMLYLGSQLAKQKKNDYKPKDDDLSFARTTTEPCVACCEYLEKVREAAKQGLSGANLEAMYIEIGVGFHSLLLDHYKKFPVNPTGGLMLTKDLAAYQELFQTYAISNSTLNDRFDMLRQLGNSFIVQPDVLKSYLTESYLGRIDMRLLRPYLMQRSDWQTFAKQFNLAEEDLGSASAAETAAANQTGKGFLRGSRLSMGIGAAAGMSRLKEMLRDIDHHAFGEEGNKSTQRMSGGPRSPTQKRVDRTSVRSQMTPSHSYPMLPMH